MSLSLKIKQRLQSWLGVSEIVDIPADVVRSHKRKKPGMGKVVTAKRTAEYVPGGRRAGGRVVRVMPKELKQIKAGQESLHEL